MSIKSALVVGLNYYEGSEQNCLSFCSNDAMSISDLLESNYDGSPNFEVERQIAFDATSTITTENLLQSIKRLFSNRHNETVVFYFSGHGLLTPDNNGYIATSNYNGNTNLGISMVNLIQLANSSPSRNKVIILDACHSGYLGSSPTSQNVSFIGEGVTILTASSAEQVSVENQLLKQGVFTNLLLEGLRGGAANILGQITPGAIYSYIDKSLGNLEQRPVFKTYTNSFIEIRKSEPAIDINNLRKISIIFDNPDQEYHLDQTYESDEKVPEEYQPKKPCNPDNLKIFRILQEYNKVGIVVPVGETYMYYAAMHEKSCKLTNYGKHYWNLAYRRKV